MVEVKNKKLNIELGAGTAADTNIADVNLSALLLQIFLLSKYHFITLLLLYQTY